jgi:hypothetical protein
MLAEWQAVGQRRNASTVGCLDHWLEPSLLLLHVVRVTRRSFQVSRGQVSGLMLWLLQRTQHVRIEACIFRTTKRSFIFSARFQFPRQPRVIVGHAAKHTSPPPQSFREAVERSAEEKSFTEALGRPSIKNQCLVSSYPSPSRRSR